MAMTDHDRGFEDAKNRAMEICITAINAYLTGAGSDHSLEARRIGQAQAQWCLDEISTITANRG